MYPELSSKNIIFTEFLIIQLRLNAVFVPKFKLRIDLTKIEYNPQNLVVCLYAKVQNEDEGHWLILQYFL